jgi:hypothetical protein
MSVVQCPLWSFKLGNLSSACSTVNCNVYMKFLTEAVFSYLKKYYVKKRFLITSNLRYMYGVLNVDEIKN